MPDPLVQLDGIEKHFGGVTALAGVSLELRAGEVHSLCGENGAGKSTLIKILTGVHQPDGGTIRVDGRPVRFGSPSESQAAGIAVIHQEFQLFPAMSVLENVFAGMPYPRTPLGLINWAAVRARVTKALEEVGAHLDLRTPIRALSAARKQEVSIARAMLLQARVLLLDEPTASLPREDAEALFRLVKGLRKKGVAIVYISHHLDEVFELSDRISVLRDGRLVASLEARNATPPIIVREMVGRELAALTEVVERTAGEPVLEIEGLTRAGEFEDIRLTLRKGEIVGLSGLVGAGRSEIAHAVFGVTRAESGTVRLAGREVAFGSPAEAVAAGVAYVSEDRQISGIHLEFTIRENHAMAVLRRLSSFGFVRRGAERAASCDLVARLRVKCESPETPVRNLSGGNQQKVLLGKWLATAPKVLILDEPTKGVDVGAKAEIHKLVFELAKDGLAVLVISSDLPEILTLADRIVVLRTGRIAGELKRRDATQEGIMKLATVGAS